MALNRSKNLGAIKMRYIIDKLELFYTIDSNIDQDENNYCINMNFENMYKKINELIEEVNELKGDKK